MKIEILLNDLPEDVQAEIIQSLDENGEPDFEKMSTPALKKIMELGKLKTDKK